MFYELVSLIFCKDLLISYCFGVRSEKRSDRDTERAKQGNGQFMCESYETYMLCCSLPNYLGLNVKGLNLEIMLFNKVWTKTP